MPDTWRRSRRLAPVTREGVAQGTQSVRPSSAVTGRDASTDPDRGRDESASARGLLRIRRAMKRSWALLAWLGAAACVAERNEPSLPPVYGENVAPLLERRCASCHSGASPAGGWSIATYIDVIACVGTSGAAATLPADGSAPILQALGSATHQGIVGAEERTVLEAWVRAGAPAFRGTVHAAGIVDPRSADWHGTKLRAAHWAPMLDANNDEACGRCHEGVPSRPAGVNAPAPGATACTTCHDQPDGVLACGTCHGDRARAYPPRDACFFPSDAPKAGAHRAHLEASSLRAGTLECASCHPMPPTDVISGVHGNGSVDIAFDKAVTGPEASYDRATGQCAVSCHDRGGARARPMWSDATPMACGDCHSSPPANHFAGACSTCHREANAAGTSLVAAALHLNGKVDLGDGSGGCGACHGHADDPWPTTGAHAAHETPTLTAAIDCASCHVVPAAVIAPRHLDGVVQVVFAGRATDRAQAPLWDGKTCSDVACHGAGLRDRPDVVPAWTDTSGSAGACGACHGIPPSQHTASTSCDRSTCHGTEVARTIPDLMISPEGRALHVNGVIDVAAP